MKKLLKNQSGLTLVEVLLSITIIGIVAVFLIPLFSNSFTMIHNSGAKSKALYTSQQDIEQVIAGQTMPSTMSISQANQTISISINGTTTSVTGDLLQTEIEYGTKDQNTLIYYFKVN